MVNSIRQLLAQAFVFDYETKDPYIGLNMGAGWVFSIQHPDLAKGFPISVSSRTKDSAQSFYDNNVNKTAFTDLDMFTLDEQTVICGQNLPYDIGWYLAQKFKGQPDMALKYLRDMYNNGVLLLDTKLLARLSDEHMMSVSLEAMAKMFKVTQKSHQQLADDFYNTGAYAADKLERTGQKTHTRPADKTLLSCAYSNLDKVTPEIVVSYCEDDVKATYELMEKFISRLLKEYSEEELLKLLQRYSAMLYLSIDMRLRGVPVHIGTLRDACKDVGDKLEEARKNVMKLLQDSIETADKEYMTKFLLQFYWHPKDNTIKETMGLRLRLGELEDLQPIWNKYETAVYDFIHIVQENKFDELKFSGSSPHPALMFLLTGYKKEDFAITATGRVSTAKQWIEEQDSELGVMLNRVRKVEKIMSGFIQPAMNTQDELQNLEQEYGVVYPEFIVGGARSMRYSCRNPNLQQVPKRDPEFRPICRGMFHAPKGKAFLAPDFSSQEQRLQVHVAYKLGAAGADKLKEEWDKDPNMDFHMKVAVMTDLICPKKCAVKSCPDCKAGRTSSKNVSLGKGYGMGEKKLCKTLGLPTEKAMIRGKEVEVAGKEGKAIIAKYDRLMPFIKQTIEILTNVVKEEGYVQAACGRHVHCPYFLAGYKREYLYHKLFNYVIQGSAAGQLHIGLAKIYDFICKNPDCGLELVGTVHDEILAVSDLDKVNDSIEVLEKGMKSAIPLVVPVVVDTQIGQSWLGGDLNENEDEHK